MTDAQIFHSMVGVYVVIWSIVAVGLYTTGRMAWGIGWCIVHSIYWVIRRR